MAEASGGLLGYGNPAGYWPLRREIPAHLATARAVRCDPEQVIVVSGSQQALDLASRVLLDPGDAVWIEDPGYMGARGTLAGSGARLVPVPVDEEGLVVAAGIKREPGARLACVTPSHQYPLGVTMSLTRRLELLGWAERSGAWVIEDDYDSEHRYTGRPLEALQGLDAEGRVVYVGTFSKVLFPALRLGYLVVPPDLTGAFTVARELVDRHPPTVEQAVLAEFIAAGHFGRHLRRMRALYAARQEALIEKKSHISSPDFSTPAPPKRACIWWDGFPQTQTTRRPRAGPRSKASKRPRSHSTQPTKTSREASCSATPP